MAATTVCPDITDEGVVLRVTLGSPRSLNVYKLRDQIGRRLGVGRVFVTTKLRGGARVTREMAIADLLALLDAAAASRDDLRVKRRLTAR